MNRAQRYVGWVERRSAGVLAAALGLTLVGAALASRLELKTDFAELLPREAPAVRELERMGRRIGGRSTVVVAVEGGDWHAREAFVEELATALRTRLAPGRVDYIDYRVSDARRFYERNRYLYAELADLQEVLDRLQKKVADAERRALVVQLDADAPYALSFDDLRRKYQERVAEYDHFPDGYFITPDRSLQALLLRVPSSALGEASADRIIDEVRAVCDGLGPERRGYRVLIGGDPVAAQDERRAVVADLTVVSASAVALVCLAMILYYRSKRALVLIGAPVVVGVALSFGLAELAIGSINSNTAFLGSIIVGNGINSGIILLARYLEERRAGGGARAALELAVGGTWLATATAAGVASLAYASLMVTHFRGFSQFGLIGGAGMLLCWLATYTVMPALIFALERVVPARVAAARPAGLFAALGRRVVRVGWARAALIAGALATVASGIVAARFYRDPFEYDFRTLRARQSQKSGASALGARVDRIFDGTSLSAGSPAVVLIDRPEQLEPLVAALAARRAAGAFLGPVESIASLLPNNQDPKLEVLRRIRALLDAKQGALSPDEQKQAAEYRPPEGLAALGLADLPEPITRPYQERDGRRGLLVYVYPPPGTDFLDGKLLLRFSDAIREVRLPDGTLLRTSGHEVVLAEILRVIVADGPKATAVAFLGALALVVLTFRSARQRTLVLGTLLVGVVWMCGAAALLHVKINMLNFVALPITFGIGVEYPVNLYRRYLAGGGLAEAVARTGSAVALCSLTTIIGYGSLLFADMRALNSFGLLAVLGEVTTLAAALLWMPALLGYSSSRPSQRA